MNFPELTMNAIEACLTISVKQYVTKFLLPLIHQATADKNYRMFFQNQTNQTAKYSFSNKAKTRHIINNEKLPLTGRYLIPDHADLAAYFAKLGYNITCLTDSYFIMDWSNLIPTMSRQSPLPAIKYNELCLEFDIKTIMYFDRVLQPIIDLNFTNFDYIVFKKMDNFTLCYGKGWTEAKDNMPPRNKSLTPFFPTSKYAVPSERQLVKLFRHLGYKFYGDDMYGLIISWANFKIKKPSLPKITHPKITTPTLQSLFYIVALETLSNKYMGTFWTLTFNYNSPEQAVYAFNPVQPCFVNFTTDLNSLIDARHTLGYEITFYDGADQEKLLDIKITPECAQKIVTAEL